MANLLNKDYRVYLDFLKSNNIPHTITYTSRTHSVDSALSKMVFSGGTIKLKGMNLIRKVNKHVTEKLESLKHLDIDYVALGLTRFDYNKKEVDVTRDIRFNRVVEIDLKKAYWVSAYKLGIIDEEIFEFGMEGLKSKSISKIELLAALGSLAKRKSKMTYNVERKVYAREVVEDSAETRFLWDAISWEVDKLMKLLANHLGNEFLFYWTDAVFFVRTAENIGMVKEIIVGEGFESETLELQYISVEDKRGFENEKGIVAWTRYKKGSGSIRDNDGNYGRCFPFGISSLDKILKWIEEATKKP